MGIYQAIRRFKNRLFYGSENSPLDYSETEGFAPHPSIEINIDSENDDLSDDPFYGDNAIARRISGEEQTDHE